MGDKQSLNNNSFFRGISNGLDKVVSRDNPAREFVHGVYHESQYMLNKNPREHERAKDKFGSAFGGKTNHLKEFDNQHHNAKTDQGKKDNEKADQGKKDNSKETNK